MSTSNHHQLAQAKPAKQQKKAQLCSERQKRTKHNPPVESEPPDELSKWYNIIIHVN